MFFSWLDYVVFRSFYMGICIFISIDSYHSCGPVLRKYGVTAIIGFKCYYFNRIVIRKSYRITFYVTLTNVLRLFIAEAKKKKRKLHLL